MRTLLWIIYLVLFLFDFNRILVRYYVSLLFLYGLVNSFSYVYLPLRHCICLP